MARDTGLVLADADTDIAPICCAAIDSSATYLASCTEDKLLSLWRIDGLTLLSTRPLPKRPTAIEFSRDAQTIVVADKFGDVFSYPLHYTPLTEIQSRDALASHENPSGGTLVLGHTSLLTAFLFSHDERYIITADRDEHIRVSWFPQGFVIEMYCLGHEKYVSAIHVPPYSPSTLVSGGGDPVLKVWDWMSGAIQFELGILDAVRPFVVVAVKPKRGGDNDDDELRSNSKGKKRKGNKNPATEEFVQPRYALVIHRIASIQHAGQIHLFFNAVGATALFTCALTSNAVIQSFDLQKPVLDFSISEDGLVWAILDGSWTHPGEDDTTTNVVRILRLTPSGELAEVTSGPHDHLLGSLMEFSAATTGSKNLDFYTDLTWLPKRNGSIDTDAKSDLAPSEGLAGSNEEQEKQLTKRELGRLRNKRKVQARAQEAAVAALEDEEKAEPTTKRIKS
ncbi:hypothetical protein APHAL10511_004344 [Amanita phalloides]|nr:hypothetical protein APHAL10511_004344 [Amanita phalloides]